MVSTSVKVIQDKEFMHKIRSENGIVFEEYLINNVPMEKDEYQKQLEFEYVKYLRSEQELFDQKNKKRFMHQQELHCLLLKKTIDSILFELIDLIDHARSESLKNYLAYQLDGIRDRHHLEELYASMDSWKNQEKKLLQQYDVLGLQQLLMVIEKVHNDFENLLHQSIQKAITQCDDTVILKKILALVSR